MKLKKTLFLLLLIGVVICLGKNSNAQSYSPVYPYQIPQTDPVNISCPTCYAEYSVQVSGKYRCPRCNNYFYINLAPLLIPEYPIGAPRRTWNKKHLNGECWCGSHHYRFDRKRNEFDRHRKCDKYRRD